MSFCLTIFREKRKKKEKSRAIIVQYVCIMRFLSISTTNLIVAN